MEKSYVYYDGDTGKVFGVSNVKNENNGSYIVVNHKDVKDVFTGKLSTQFLSVEMDVKTKEFVLVNRKSNDEVSDNKDINDYLYEVPDIYTDEYDILIEQNQVNGYWRISMGEKIRTALTNSFIGNYISFSITQKRNPNIYYNRLDFDLKQIVLQGFAVVPFKDDFELDSTPISLYTDKKFDVYVYQRIKE